ncbi:MAG: nucleoside triphosphate pyrophosphohydrolase [Pseudomonadales bacterium]
MRTKHDLNDLLQLMRDLRHPEHGCPWDLQQDHASIVPHTLEEAYEVADAIERGDSDDLKQELGDLLFQVVFYSQLSSEQQDFDFSDVVDAITAKLLRRHPHVFPDGTLASAGVTELKLSESDIKRNWEKIKQQERREKTQHSITDDVPRALPALTRANKLQRRVAHVGFDWTDTAEVVAKIREELDELEEALANNDDSHIAEELGDLLFTCVNLARRKDISPEAALNGCNEKFVRRFKHIERLAEAQGRELADMSLEELDAGWEAAKREGL